MVTHFVFQGCSHICHMYSFLSFSSIYPASAPSNFLHASHFLERRIVVVGLLLFSPSFSGISWSSVPKARNYFKWEFSSIYWNIENTQVSASLTPSLWIGLCCFLQWSHFLFLIHWNPQILFLKTDNFFSIPCLCRRVFLLTYSGSWCLPRFFPESFIYQDCSISLLGSGFPDRGLLQ